MVEEVEEEPLTPSRALYGTGLTGMFSDNLSHRYTSYLAVSIGLTLSQMSLLRAVQSLSSNVLQLVWGRLVDRHGKKIFLSVGRFLNGALIGAIIFVRTPAWFMSLVIGASICLSLVMPAWSSLLGDYTSSSTRGATIGRINSLSQIGGLTAMIFAFVTSFNQVGETTPESYTTLLVMSAAMNFVSGVLGLFAEEKPPAPTEERLDVARVFMDPTLRRYLLVNIVYGISMSFSWPLMPFIVVDKLDMKIWQIAAFSIASSGSSLLSQRHLGNLMDRIGRRPVVVFSRVSMAIAPLVYALATSWLHIVVADVILGVGMGAWMSSGPTYIIDIAPRELRATYLAANTAVFGVSTFVGNLVGGFVTDNFLAVGGGFEGIQTGLLISAALRFLTGLLYFKIYETHTRRE
jgi:MFS family permease